MSRSSAISAILERHGAVTIAFDVGVGTRWDHAALGARNGRAVVELDASSPEFQWEPGEYIAGHAHIPGRAAPEPVCVLMEEIRWVATPGYAYRPSE